MEKNEYHLIIDINGDVGGGAVSESSGGSGESKDYSKALTRLVRYEVAQPFINSTKQIIQNDVDTYFGSSELSQRIQFSLDAVHTARSSVVHGMALSTALGISTGAGVGLGLALAVGHKLLDIMVKANEINNKTRLENEQLQILRGRAGIQFNRSRMGE